MNQPNPPPANGAFIYPFQEGTKIGDSLEIIKPLGQGGMGAVYLAYHAFLEKEVALKIISPFLIQDQDAQIRFAREAKTAVQLSHPHIVQIYGAGEVDGLKYIVMEYVEGMTLRKLLDHRSPLPPKIALKLILQVAQALAEAHGKQILHRDVKPENILVTRQGVAKLSDFGIARNLHQSRITQTGYVVGTPEYMSPEQILGQQLDGRADIYSLGATFYHCLVGNSPFEGDSSITVLYHHLEDTIYFPREMITSIPSHYRHLIHQMMAKEKWRRPDDAEKLVQALNALEAPPEAPLKETKPLTSQPVIEIQPKTRTSKIPSMENLQDLLSLPTETEKPLSRKKSLLFFLVGCAILVGLLLGGMAGYTALQQRFWPEKKKSLPVIPPLPSSSPPASFFQKIQQLTQKRQFHRALEEIEIALLRYAKSDRLKREKAKIQKQKKEYLSQLLLKSRQFFKEENYLRAIRTYEEVIKLEGSQRQIAEYGVFLEKAAQTFLEEKKFSALELVLHKRELYGTTEEEWLEEWLENRRREFLFQIYKLKGFYQSELNQKKSALASWTEKLKKASDPDCKAYYRKFGPLQKKYDGAYKKYHRLRKKYKQTLYQAYLKEWNKIQDLSLGLSSFLFWKKRHFIDYQGWLEDQMEGLQ